MLAVTEETMLDVLRLIVVRGTVELLGNDWVELDCSVGCSEVLTKIVVDEESEIDGEVDNCSLVEDKPSVLLGTIVELEIVVDVNGGRMTLTFLEIDTINGYRSCCLLSARQVKDVI